MSTHMAKGEQRSLRTACGRDAWFRVGAVVLALPVTIEPGLVDCPACLQEMAQEAA